MAESAKFKKYEMVRKSSKKSQERNDCSVKAVSMAGRVSYKEAHRRCAEHGRINNKGMMNSQINSTLEDLGFELQLIENLYQKNGSKYTPKTIGKRLKAGYYIVYVKGHVFPVINGTVFDWSANRQHRIYQAYKIVRKRT